MGTSNSTTRDQDRQLDKKDLPDILERLHKASLKWFELGLVLGISHDDLERIKNCKPENYEVCLREMLVKGIESGVHLTWPVLCKSLRSKLVDRVDVAKEIEGELGIKDADQTSRKRLYSAIDDCEEVLDEESWPIYLDYCKLLQNTSESLIRRGISPERLSTLLVKKLQMVSRDKESREENLIRNKECYWETLNKAKSIDSIFDAILPWLTFLDYDLLEDIITAYGDQTDEQNLKAYKCELKKVLKNWEAGPKRQKIPRTVNGSASENDQIELCFKVKAVLMREVRKLKKILKNIFAPEADNCIISLTSIDNGCVELVFLFPKAIVDRSLPLTPSQKAQLAAVTPSILSVTVVGETTKQVIFKADEAATVPEQLKNQVQRMIRGLVSWVFEKHVSIKLLEACRSDTQDIILVKYYLKHDDCIIDIIEDDENMWTPLMWACEKRHTKISKLLLEHHPRVNMQSKKEWSALHLASRAGDLEIVQGIVALGAEIDKPTNKNWTPLMWSAQAGHAEVAKFLLDNGAFVDYQDVNGWTPLMQASQEGHLDVVNVLLDYGANVNYMIDHIFWCALMAAAKNKHSEVVDALLKRGAYVDITRDDGCTALYVAVHYENNTDVVETLLKHKANIDLPNKRGRTALMLAAEKGHLDLVQSLINGGADINQRCPSNGYTAIFFAAENGHMSIFKELLDHGAETEIEGLKVVNVASINDREEILSLLGETVSDDQQPRQSGLVSAIRATLTSFREQTKEFFETYIFQHKADSPRSLDTHSSK